MAKNIQISSRGLCLRAKKSWEIQFEDKLGYDNEYGFGFNSPYLFKGDFASLILHLDELRLKNGVICLDYQEEKTFADLEETQELVKCFCLNNALLIRETLSEGCNTP